MSNFENQTEKSQEREKSTKEKINEIIEDDDFDIVTEFQDKIFDFVKKLREVYDDYQEYEMYHLLTGSSLAKEYSQTDFAGEDSVEEFVNGLYHEYLEKKK